MFFLNYNMCVPAHREFCGNGRSQFKGNDGMSAMEVTMHEDEENGEDQEGGGEAESDERTYDHCVDS